MDIRIRLMSEAEVHSVNEVYNKAYGSIRPDSFFDWEFMKGPWGKAIYVVAEDLQKEGNKIIGTQSAIPIMLTNGKESILTAKSEDTFVDPAYRGHKLFDKMYEMLFSECRKAGIRYIWGFTYARKPFEKIGFEIPFESLQGIRVKKPFKAAKVLIGLNPGNKTKDKLKIYLGSMYSFVNSAVKSGGSKTVSLDHSFDFFSRNQSKELTGNSLWSIDFTPEYMDWRIKTNPYRNKFATVVSDDSALIVNKKEDGVVYIEEILSNNWYKADLAGSMKQMISSVDKEMDSSLMRYWGFQTNAVNSKQIELLKQSGFTFINKGTFFVWKDLNKDGEVLINPANLLVSRLYTQGNR